MTVTGDLIRFWWQKTFYSLKNKLI